MPLVDAQPDALARVYATSLIELAEAAGGRELAEEILGELEDILELARSDARFSEFLASRVLSKPQRAQSLRTILKGRCRELTLNFLLLLNEKDRLGHLPAIVGSFDQLVQERFGRVEVDVYTAQPIGSAELAQVKSRLQAALAKEVIVHPYTDTSIIGGIKVRVGDQLIDGSISAQLRQLRQRLQQRGAGELRSRFDRLIDDTD